MKLYNILKKVIIEASLDQVTNSIKNKNVVTLYYYGNEDGGQGLRVVEPYCVGTSKKGNKVLRAYDLEGASHTAKTGEQPLPGWRLFRLDRIGNYSPDPRQTFTRPRELYNPDDKGMVGMKTCAQFELENTEEI